MNSRSVSRYTTTQTAMLQELLWNALPNCYYLTSRGRLALSMFPLRQGPLPTLTNESYLGEKQ